MAVRNQSDRINFGKLREVIVPPNLIEIQITSYLDFLQKGIPEKQRKPQGLEGPREAIAALTQRGVAESALRYSSFAPDDFSRRRPLGSVIQEFVDGQRIRLHQNDVAKRSPYWRGAPAKRKPELMAAT